MIDYYEKVDFDQEVWVLDGGRLEQQVLRDVCREHGDDDRNYRAEGCELFEYRPNHQLPRSVVATFDTEAEAEHAYWLLLLHNVTTTDTAPLIYWSAGDAAECCSEEIDSWLGEDVGVLRYWLRTLDNVCEAGDLDQQAYVDMAELGGVPLPDDVETCFPVWAMDQKGDMLVGDGADDIENIDNYRANKEAA
jgi:hypothetical protein